MPRVQGALHRDISSIAEIFAPQGIAMLGIQQNIVPSIKCICRPQGRADRMLSKYMLRSFIVTVYKGFDAGSWINLLSQSAKVRYTDRGLSKS